MYHIILLCISHNLFLFWPGATYPRVRHIYCFLLVNLAAEIVTREIIERLLPHIFARFSTYSTSQWYTSFYQYLVGFC